MTTTECDFAAVLTCTTLADRSSMPHTAMLADAQVSTSYARLAKPTTQPAIVHNSQPEPYAWLDCAEADMLVHQLQGL